MLSWRSVAIAGLLFFAAADAITFRASAVEEWKAYNEAEAEDRNFWTQEWGSVERELTELQEAAMATVRALHPSPHTAVADLQIAANPVKKPEEKKTEEKKEPKKQAAEKKTEQHQLMKKEHPGSKDSAKDDVAAALAKAGLGKMLDGKQTMSSIIGKEAALAPMLAMLKGLYEQGRDRIGDLNKREKEQKEKFAKHVAEHKRRMDRIEAKFKNHTLSEEFRKNETRDETRMFTYWEHCRDRQHKQYHNMLKIQHGTMEREKMMIDMYEKTLNKGSSEKDHAKVAKQLSEMTGGGLGGGMPEVVLLSTAQSLAQFCDYTLAEVKQDRAELDSWRTEPQQSLAKRSARKSRLLQGAK